MSNNLTPEQIFMKDFKCPSNCEYNVYTNPDIKGTKNGYICNCICMKAFVAGYNKCIELKTKENM